MRATFRSARVACAISSGPWPSPARQATLYERLIGFLLSSRSNSFGLHRRCRGNLPVPPCPLDWSALRTSTWRRFFLEPVVEGHARPRVGQLLEAHEGAVQ